MVLPQMGELGSALNTLFAKVGDFFDIFDLSFFVAGAVCLGALAFGNSLGGFIDPVALSDGYKAIMFAVACYVLGLICFAGGRLLRAGRATMHQPHFRDAVERHGLLGVYGEYLKNSADSYLLYNRFWAEMRQTPSLAPSFLLLRRYWSMAATYDGLCTSLMVWAGVIVYWCWHADGIPLPLKVVPLGLLPLCVLLCRREAGRLSRFQVEELAASIAAYERTLRREPAA